MSRCEHWQEQDGKAYCGRYSHRIQPDGSTCVLCEKDLWPAWHLAPQRAPEAWRIKHPRFVSGASHSPVVTGKCQHCGPVTYTPQEIAAVKLRRAQVSLTAIYNYPL